MLEVQHIFKSYEGEPLLRDISFQVDTGETVCLLGASGSGKSTLLRIISGLEEADSGHILFDGTNITMTPPHLRDFGLVFQDYALFPHLNVNENVAFGLKMRRLPKTEIEERIASSLEMVDLGGFGARRVTDLSGGEQQRVALARALATRPRLLMFDEPLGALDRTLREGLLNELRAILERTNVPAIYVTHDQEEAFAIADRLLILQDGQIIRAGTPAQVWADPESVFVAEFLGLGNVLEGEVRSKKKEGEWVVTTTTADFVARCEHPHETGDLVHFLVRPTPHNPGDESSEPNGEPGRSAVNIINDVVSDVIFQQDRFTVTLENGLYFYLPNAPARGEKIELRIKVECLG